MSEEVTKCACELIGQRESSLVSECFAVIRIMKSSTVEDSVQDHIERTYQLEPHRP